MHCIMKVWIVFDCLWTVYFDCPMENSHIMTECMIL